MIKKKPKKPKKLRCGGSINTSNVNGGNQCITLTYAVKNVGVLLVAKKLITDMEDLVPNEYVEDEGGTTSTIEIHDVDTNKETIDVKIKVQSCLGEGEAHDIKTKLDTFLKKKGGQTTLDEVTTS